jgi:nucleoside-diphosphate-sugar epimerase
LQQKANFLGKVIVTGGSGFIGRNVIPGLIEQGHEVIAWARSPQTAEFWQQRGVRVEIGDLSDIASSKYASECISTIIHLAAIVAPNSRAETFAANVDTTERIVNGVSRWQTPPRFLFVSSLAASGPCINEVPRREIDPCQPRSIYGESKAAAEKMLATFADRVPISIARPPGVFGPWDRNLLTLFQSVRRRINLVGISQQFRYSFVHVQDLAAGLVAILSSGKNLIAGDDKNAQGIYFLADPQAVTFVELANMIADSLAINPPFHITVPSPVCHAVATLSQFYGQVRKRPTYLNRDKMREAVAGSWVCDPSRASDELGFTVARKLSNRIIDTADWYRQQNWIAK